MTDWLSEIETKTKDKFQGIGYLFKRADVVRMARTIRELSEVVKISLETPTTKMAEANHQARRSIALCNLSDDAKELLKE